jgi:hypothetical protein
MNSLVCWAISEKWLEIIFLGITISSTLNCIRRSAMFEEITEKIDTITKQLEGLRGHL